MSVIDWIGWDTRAVVGYGDSGLVIGLYVTEGPAHGARRVLHGVLEVGELVGLCEGNKGSEDDGVMCGDVVAFAGI